MCFYPIKFKNLKVQNVFFTYWYKYLYDNWKKIYYIKYLNFDLFLLLFFFSVTILLQHTLMFTLNIYKNTVW